MKVKCRTSHDPAFARRQRSPAPGRRRLFAIARIGTARTRRIGEVDRVVVGVDVAVPAARVGWGRRWVAADPAAGAGVVVADADLVETGAGVVLIAGEADLGRVRDERLAVGVIGVVGGDGARAFRRLVGESDDRAESIDQGVELGVLQRAVVPVALFDERSVVVADEIGCRGRGRGVADAVIIEGRDSEQGRCERLDIGAGRTSAIS